MSTVEVLSNECVLEKAPPRRTAVCTKGDACCRRHVVYGPRRGVYKKEGGGDPLNAQVGRRRHKRGVFIGLPPKRVVLANA